MTTSGSYPAKPPGESGQPSLGVCDNRLSPPGLSQDLAHALDAHPHPRLMVTLQWLWQYLTFQTGARLITTSPPKRSVESASETGSPVVRKTTDQAIA